MSAGMMAWSDSLMAVAVVALTVVLVVLMRRKPPTSRMKRSMSFTSSIMLDGSMPDNVQMIDPIINAVLLYEDAPTDTAILELMGSLLTYERLSKIPVKDKAKNAWVWEEPSGFDIKRHLISMSVASEKELWTTISDIGPKKLLRPGGMAQPIWEFVVIRNSGGKSALIMRLHHTVGDGISIVSVMNRLLTDKSGAPLKMQVPFQRKDGAGKGMNMGMMGKILSALGTCLYVGVSPYDTDLLFTSGPAKKKIVFKGARKVVLMPDVEESLIKDLKNAAKVTFNDVMFSAFGGAIRRYCARRNDPLLARGGPVQIRALLPVAFPRSESEASDPTRVLRNKFCFVSAAMPVGQPTAAERLTAANKTMNGLKNSPVAPMQLWLQDNLVAKLPLVAQRQFAFDAFSRHSVVFSNVPGPKIPVMAAGKEIVGLQMVFPNIIPQVGILSYRGMVHANMVVDDEVVTSPEMLRECFVEELREMAASLGVEVPEAVAGRLAALEGF